jgi:hypothetical protein
LVEQGFAQYVWIKKRYKIMAATFISKKSLPAPTRGSQASTNPNLSVSEMGGVRVNSYLVKKLAGILGLHLAWDNEERKLTFTGLTVLPKGVTAEDLFELNVGEKGKGQSTIPGITSFLRMQEYDYKASGNQNFTVTEGATKSGAYQFSIVLPKGSLTPPVKAPRAPRKPKSPTATPSTTVASVDAGVADLI